VSELTSAAITLRAADGSRLGDAGPITSDTVRDHAPAPQAIATVEGWFRDRGFTVESSFANSFTITASPETFVAVFGTTGSDEDPILPLDRLADDIRELLDTVSFTHVDLGPDDF
jgi:hypothetical protein